MRTKPPNRTPNKARNMSSRQPVRRPLGPTKIGFHPNVKRELGWKALVDNTGKFSAAFSRFAEVIFPSWIRNGPDIKEIEAARAVIRASDLCFVFSAVPIQVVSCRQKTLQRKLPHPLNRCWNGLRRGIHGRSSAAQMHRSPAIPYASSAAGDQE